MNLSRFKKTLFSDSSINIQLVNLREEVFVEIKSDLEQFLCMISCHLNQNYSLYCIEWLIWKYRVDLNCTDKFIYCVIPYYETGLLPKFAQVLDFTKIDKSYDWLHPYSISGSCISKKNLTKLAIKRKTLTNFLAECILSFIKSCDTPEYLKDISNFTLSLIYEITDVKIEPDKMENILSNFQTVIQHGLKSIKMVRSTMLLLILRLSSCLKLDREIIHGWLKEILKNRQDGLEWEALQTAYNLMLQQDYSNLSNKLCNKRDILISMLDAEKSLLMSSQFDNLVIPEKLESLTQEKMDVTEIEEEHHEKHTKKIPKVDNKENLKSSLKRAKRALKKAQAYQIFGETWSLFVQNPSDYSILKSVENIFKGKLDSELANILQCQDEEIPLAHVTGVALKIINKQILQDENVYKDFISKFKPYLVSFLISPACDSDLRQTSFTILANFCKEEMEDKQTISKSLMESPLSELFNNHQTFFNQCLNILQDSCPYENPFCWSNYLLLFREDLIRHIVSNINSSNDIIVHSWRSILDQIEHLFSTEENISFVHVELAFAAYKNFFNNTTMAQFIVSEKLAQKRVSYESLVVKCVLTLIGNLCQFIEGFSSEKTLKIKKLFFKIFGKDFEPSAILDKLSMNYSQFINSLQFCGEGFSDKNNMRSLELQLSDSVNLQIVRTLLESFLRSKSLISEEFSFQLNKLELSENVKSNKIAAIKMTSLDALVNRSDVKSLNEFGRVKSKNQEETILKRLNLAIDIGVGVLRPLSIHLINFIEGQRKLEALESFKKTEKTQEPCSDSEDEDFGFVSGDDHQVKTERNTLINIIQTGINRIIDSYTHVFESIETLKTDQLEELLKSCNKSVQRKMIKKRLNFQSMSKELKLMAKSILDPVFLAIDLFTSSICFQQKVLACLTSAAHIYPCLLSERIVQMLHWILTSKSNQKNQLFRFDNENSVSIIARLISSALPHLLESAENPNSLCVTMLGMFVKFLKSDFNSNQASIQCDEIKIRMFSGIIHTLSQCCFPYPRTIDNINALKKKKIDTIPTAKKKPYWLWTFWVMNFHDEEIEVFMKHKHFYVQFCSQFSCQIQLSAFCMMTSYFTILIKELDSIKITTTSAKRKKDNSICISESSNIDASENEINTSNLNNLDMIIESEEDVEKISNIFSTILTSHPSPVKKEQSTRKRALDSSDHTPLKDNQKVWTVVERVMSCLSKIYCLIEKSNPLLIFHEITDNEYEIAAYTTLVQRLIHFSHICSQYSTESFTTPLSIVNVNHAFIIQLQNALPANLNLRFICDMFNLSDNLLSKKAIELTFNFTSKILSDRRRAKADCSSTEDLLFIVTKMVELIFVNQTIELTQNSMAKSSLGSMLNIIKLVGSTRQDQILEQIRVMCKNPSYWWPNETTKTSHGNIYAESRSIFSEILKECISLSIINENNLGEFFNFLTMLAIDHTMTALRFDEAPRCIISFTGLTESQVSAGSIIHRDSHVLVGLELLSTLIELSINKNTDLFHFSPYHLPHVQSSDQELSDSSLSASISGFIVWMICKVLHCDLKLACGLKPDNDGQTKKINELLLTMINLIIMLPSAKDIFITLYMLMKYSLKTHETSLVIGIRRFIGSMHCFLNHDLLTFKEYDKSSEDIRRMLNSHLGLIDSQSRNLILSLFYSLNDIPNWLITDILKLDTQDNLTYKVFCDEGVNASLNIIMGLMNKDCRLSILSSLLTWSLDTDSCTMTDEKVNIGLALIKMTNIFTLLIRLCGNITTIEFIDYSRRINLLDYLVSLISLFSENSCPIRQIEIKNIQSKLKNVQPNHLASVCGESQMVGEACITQIITLLNTLFETDASDSSVCLPFNEIIIALPDSLTSLLSITKEHDDNVPIFLYDQLKDLYLNFMHFVRCDEAVMKPFLRQLCDKLTASGRKSAHWSTRKSIILLLRDILQRSLGLDTLDNSKIMTVNKEEVNAASLNFNKNICQEIMNALSHAMEDERIEVELEASRLNADLSSAMRTFSVSF